MDDPRARVFQVFCDGNFAKRWQIMPTELAFLEHNENKMFVFTGLFTYFC